jgi:hypothetical protein
MDIEQPRNQRNGSRAMRRQNSMENVERDHSGHAHAHTSPQTKRDMSHIAGWGVDLDHANRPAYPKERMPARLEGVHWSQPEDQPVNIEVFHSTERPGITPVFGTSSPPSGLSGRIRELAYRLSENDIRHWLLLLFADRVNVVEGIGQDLAQGRVPNVFAEMGGRAEWKYNRSGLIRKAAVASAVVGVGYYLIKRGRARAS